MVNIKHILRYKFNDIHVNQVNEEKVMKDAFGDGK